jgi:hypothetical protein
MIMIQICLLCRIYSDPINMHVWNHITMYIREMSEPEEPFFAPLGYSPNHITCLFRAPEQFALHISPQLPQGSHPYVDLCEQNYITVRSQGV